MWNKALAGSLALALTAMTADAAARETTAAVEEEPGGAKYPEYVVGGAISLAAAAGFAVGGTIAAIDDSPQSAIGLLGLATVGAGVGVPLVMLGAADEQPESTFRMSTGVAIATPGVLTLGIGGTLWAAQAATEGEDELGLPIAFVIGGAVATVVGIVVYATGSGHDDTADGGTAEVAVGPTGVSLSGTF